MAYYERREKNSKITYLFEGERNAAPCAAHSDFDGTNFATKAFELPFPFGSKAVSFRLKRLTPQMDIAREVGEYRCILVS
jgi:hypothetical protein